MGNDGRILAIGLDGFEFSLAESLMNEGGLPNLRHMLDSGAHWRLDHGLAKFSGLTWEHFTSGRAPENGGRASAVAFDPKAYTVHQEPSVLAPFFGDIGSKTVIVDLPYCDLARTPRLRGLVNWGAHDPGVPRRARPDGLLQELAERFGDYPAKPYIYAFTWPSPEKTATAANALIEAVKQRTELSLWLLRDRLPDWDLGVIVVGEPHSAIEPFWHGVDPNHPLHRHPSAAAARLGLIGVYESTDVLIGRLVEAFPDATPVVFAMHGMGPNGEDVPGMALLPELLYRHAFGRSYMSPMKHREFIDDDGTPLLAEDETWQDALEIAVPVNRLRSMAGFDFRRPAATLRAGRRFAPSNIDWMPAARYRGFWPAMDAFALPSFYDGRVRINLKGRESLGRVDVSHYGQRREEIAALVRECRDLRTGEPVVAHVVHSDAPPFEIDEFEADLKFIWKGAPLGFSHPRLGQIGPLPYRRTGGHSGEFGFMAIAGDGIEPGSRGIASSFDVVPTLVRMLGQDQPAYMSGHPLPV